ncbi:MAG: hypothetical protein KJP00_09080 [Bacteroidia bacterium]|nr:hypothetical protein [Bacteroidia bacterium]
MEGIIEGSGNWFQFGLIIALSVGLILGIKVLHFIFDNSGINTGLARRSVKFLRRLPDYLEPVIVLMIATYFLSINPIMHLLILAVVFLFGYGQIKDYFTGKSMLYSNELPLRSRIEYGDKIGLIMDRSRFGIHIQTKDGVDFLRYSKLYQDGFKLNTLDTYGGYFEFQVDANNFGDMSIHDIKEMILQSPYSNILYDTQVNSSVSPGQIQFNVHLRDESHLDDLKLFLKSNGVDTL